jgi:hypothetical protein
MAKKARRIERRMITSAPAPAGVRSEGGPGEFNPDYGYVRSDLRRIGILAGTFLVLLVVLSLVVK